jgi:hypothetical protein
VEPSGFVLPRWSADRRYLNTELDLERDEERREVSPCAANPSAARMHFSDQTPTTKTDFEADVFLSYYLQDKKCF